MTPVRRWCICDGVYSHGAVTVQCPGSLCGRALTTPGFLTLLCRVLLQHRMQVSVVAAVYTAVLVVLQARLC